MNKVLKREGKRESSMKDMRSCFSNNLLRNQKQYHKEGTNANFNEKYA